jgi:hypothetical protein
VIDDPTPTADVLVDERLPPGTEDALVAALSALDLRVRVRAVPVQRDGGLTFLVLVALPLQAFLSAAGAKAAEDAYRRLKEAIRRLTARDRTTPAAARPLVLQDPATGLRIVLDADLPEPALDQLRGLDLTAFRGGPLHYDRHQNRWRSVADEAAGAGAPTGAA